MSGISATKFARSNRCYSCSDRRIRNNSSYSHIEDKCGVCSNTGRMCGNKCFCAAESAAVPALNSAVEQMGTLSEPTTDDKWEHRRFGSTELVATAGIALRRHAF